MLSAALDTAASAALSFRPMTEGDIPAVSTLARAIWQAHYPGIISQAEVDYMQELFNSEEGLRRQMEKSNFILAEREGDLCGYASVGVKAPGHLVIHKFYVDTACHRGGIGARMLDEIVTRFRPAKLSLYVSRGNWKAINFYFKTGFAISSICVTDIGNGFIMDDFVMTRAFA